MFVSDVCNIITKLPDVCFLVYVCKVKFFAVLVSWAESSIYHQHFAFSLFEIQYKPVIDVMLNKCITYAHVYISGIINFTGRNAGSSDIQTSDRSVLPGTRTRGSWGPLQQIQGLMLSQTLMLKVITYPKLEYDKL